VTAAALILQVEAKRVPRRELWDRHHEVVAGAGSQNLVISFVISLTRPSVAVPRQVGRLEPAEECGPLARPVRQDPRDQAANGYETRPLVRPATHRALHARQGVARRMCRLACA
jgi:hypothetical protein